MLQCFKSHILYGQFFSLMVVIAFLSLLPIEQPDFSPNDKINHFIAHGALAISGVLALKRIPLTIAVCFLFGLIIEILQSFTAYRFGSAADVVANSTGLGLGIIATVAFNKLVKFTRKGENNE